MLTPSEDQNRRLLRARDAMDRDFVHPLDVPALARIAWMSPTHFTRSFRATFGETPHRYLQRRRIERAMSLLRSTSATVTEVAGQVGFESLGTFSRISITCVTFLDQDEAPERAAGVWTDEHGGPARNEHGVSARRREDAGLRPANAELQRGNPAL